MAKRLILLSCLALLSTPAAAFVNGDFASGLAGWTTAGDVTATAGEASLGKSTGALEAAVLYQGAEQQSGRLVLDVRGIMSDAIVNTPPFFGLPDTLAVTLYLIDDLSRFSLNPVTPVFDDLIELFDLDYLGPSLYRGQIGPSPDKGIDWLRYSVDFVTSYRYVIPTFELFDENGLNDSQALIDNVRITGVPTPGVLALLCFGLLLAGAHRRAVRSSR